MKKYHVAAGDGKGYYGLRYESYFEAQELLKISQIHDPQAHIVEEEYYFTEADRIRAMSDEELTDAIYKLLYAEDPVRWFCKGTKECGEIMDNDGEIPDEMCRQCLLKKLQLPAEEV